MIAESPFDKDNHAFGISDNYYASLTMVSTALNINKFVKIVVAAKVSEESERFKLFWCSGRIGDRYRTKQGNEWKTLERAKQDFENKFLLLTGLQWENRNDEPVEDKYRYLKTEVPADDLQLNPLGRLAPELLRANRERLRILRYMFDQNQGNTEDFAEKVLDYYRNMPVSVNRRQRLPALNNRAALDAAERKLDIMEQRRPISPIYDDEDEHAHADDSDDPDYIRNI